jgi:hypothetical protein
MKYGQQIYKQFKYGVKRTRSPALPDTSKKQLKIYDSSLEFKGIIDNFQSYIITRKYRGIETLDMMIPFSQFVWNLVPKYNWIYAGPKRIFEILHREVDQGNPRMIRIVAFGGGKTLAKRVTVPPVGSAYDTITGSADAVVKHYIANNLTSPTDTNRLVSILSCSANQTGTSVSDQTRFKNLYDEVVRVHSIDDRGFYFDLVDGSIVFDTYAGLNRTAGNNDNPPAIFSIDYDNLLASRYTDSAADKASFTYIGGQGEGLARTIVTVGFDTGNQRFEVFQDARDTDEEEKLINRAISEQKPGIESLEVTINPSANLIYGVDYDLGDIITAKDKQLSLALDTRIVEAVESYVQGQADGLTLTYGNALPNYLSTVKAMSRKIAGLSTI